MSKNHRHIWSRHKFLIKFIFLIFDSMSNNKTNIPIIDFSIGINNTSDDNDETQILIKQGIYNCY